MYGCLRTFALLNHLFFKLGPVAGQLGGLCLCADWCRPRRLPDYGARGRHYPHVVYAHLVRAGLVVRAPSTRFHRLAAPFLCFCVFVPATSCVVWSLQCVCVCVCVIFVCVVRVMSVVRHASPPGSELQSKSLYSRTGYWDQASNQGRRAISTVILLRASCDHTRCRAFCSRFGDMSSIRSCSLFCRSMHCRALTVGLGGFSGRSWRLTPRGKPCG